MTTNTSGAAVKSGYYINLSRWAIEPVAKDGGRLPEGEGSWTRIPTVAALALVPVLGATFLMFLPVIGFALVGTAVVKRVAGGARETAAGLASTMTPGWTPGEAHLTGKPGEKPAPTSPELEKLEQDIAEKRADQAAEKK